VGNGIYLSCSETLSIALAEALTVPGMALRAGHAMVVDPKAQIAAALAGQGEPPFWPRRDNRDEDPTVLAPQ
jgi:hypothetical protein